MICIFSPAGSLTGGTYRSLRSALGFPEEAYRLYMPQDVKQNLTREITTYLGPHSVLLNIVKKAIETEPLSQCAGNRDCYVKYGKKLAKKLGKDGCDFVYIPHEHPYIPAGFPRQFRWTMLLQVTPVVGSLSVEEGRGFILYWKNVRGVNRMPIVKALRGYLRLLSYKKLLERNKTLAVSKSIPYELQLLGVRGDIVVLNPGVGVDPCPVANVPERRYDLVFFARITPEKGIYDFLQAVKKLQRIKPGLKALAMGFAAREEAIRVTEVAKRLGVDIEFRFNVERGEALAYLAQSKVMVYPTKADAFPLVVLESLSCGTPVVAYSIPAIRLNFNTEAVVRVRPGNFDEVVSATLATLENFDALSRIGRNFVANFTWDNVSADEWAKVEAIQKES
ncbi:MAG: glycosyltransferase [Pyrobaculum arsenaticum]|uniref:Glycosyl transferase, group 1 n=2 Tax=Pyrobaculum arsenaticum TaxID=121277 RepID=A4WHW4_PYRAR|nr:glycosyltransferase [Pyrobaculum arsenaticum]ABP49981.1 glycosyl transferase, group 1 [Pyrobaculum arsenaticum DSM 13514]MCY0889526.1 glycosyltransferase [Pyrobaculum arsenaticum]NYR15050.1 glycosyltransferase [Pyrobaculum arsenaticum]